MCKEINDGLWPGRRENAWRETRRHVEGSSDGGEQREKGM